MRVGLTGGIGSGKSEVAKRLRELGAVVVDYDVLAHEVVEPGQPALGDLASEFGDQVIKADGTLDREAVAAIVFSDPEARKRLNAIVHPRVGERAAEIIAELPEDRVVVHDIPLLVENGVAKAFEAVIVVITDPETQVRRLVELRGMAEADARARIAAQATSAERRAVATHVIENDGTLEELTAAVDAVWRKLTNR